MAGIRSSSDVVAGDDVCRVLFTIGIGSSDSPACKLLMKTWRKGGLTVEAVTAPKMGVPKSLYKRLKLIRSGYERLRPKLMTAYHLLC